MNDKLQADYAALRALHDSTNAALESCNAARAALQVLVTKLEQDKQTLLAELQTTRTVMGQALGQANATKQAYLVELEELREAARGHLD